MPFKLTYSTMFDPPPELHDRFETALHEVKQTLPGEHALWIAGRDARAPTTFEKRSPIDRDMLLGTFHQAGKAEVNAAVAAAAAAFPAWASRNWQERVRIVRRVAEAIESRAFEIAAVVALEIGKNRMEALGDVQETADLISWYCDQVEANQGYVTPMQTDPLPGFISRNRSVLKPYGVWAVIAPFNFPVALAGGPSGAALVAGNTVVFKASSDAPWSGRLLAECMRDAGIPDGVFNYVTGSGSVAGEALTGHVDVAGITFTGSYEIGMKLVRAVAKRGWPRPCIAEMGGKNATIVSANADLERAALGIVRSAYGLQGQKCSACSRIYVEEPVAAALEDRLVEQIAAIRVGDPADRTNWMGPVINGGAYAKYRECCDELRRNGTILAGGKVFDEGDLARGYYCAPTLASAALKHRFWREELFLPIAMIAPVKSMDEAMRLANASEFGLTAGFFGAKSEVDWFFRHIEAGVAYANRPQGATTGAWPGFQPFGGWKGSGSTGKAGGSIHYVQQYLREQSQTVID